MKRFKKILRIGGTVFIVLILIGVAAIYLISQSLVTRKYSIPNLAQISIATDSVTLARGKHLSVVANCVLCHGHDLGGGIYYQGIMGVIAGPNLTALNNGGKLYSSDDWVRSIRHGLKKDSTSMLVMPSEVFVKLSIPDLSALISYIRQAPKVNRTVPESKLHFLGRTLLATGKLSLLVAAKTDHNFPIRIDNPTDTIAYGDYLTEVYSCKGCHGSNLSGGRKMGVPGAPPSTNLTPAGIGGWTKADFQRILRTGIKYNGSRIHDIMPWQNAGQLSDTEMDAIWAYLKSTPPVQTGAR